MSEPGQHAGEAVTIGLLDGRMVNRRITRFSPRLGVLAADPETRDGATQVLLDVERLAYVGFFAHPGATDERPFDLRRLKVHVPGGKVFVVDAALPPDGAPLPPVGFFAWPAADSPFTRLFFYHHGVLRRERPELLGALLVEAGAATLEQVQRGLDAQQARIGRILIEQERVSPEAVDAAAAGQDRRRLRLGEILVEEGLATPRDIEVALVEQKSRRSRKLGETLVALKIVTEEQVAEALARKFNLLYVDIDRIPIHPRAIDEVPRELIARYEFLPIDTDERTLTIAIADPLNTGVDDVFSFFLSKKRVREVIAAPTPLRRAIERELGRAPARPADDSGLDALLRAAMAELGPEEPTAEAPASPDAEGLIIQLANKIIIDGVKRGASDIHIEPNGPELPVRVRFRIDGDCVAYRDIPGPLRGPLVARIKIMASLDIAERRKPQDGKIRFELPDRRIELRVATVPTAAGNEDVVLRVLAASKPHPVDQIGLSPGNLSRARKVLAEPYGLILCVGPTGSGKTTTLHSMLGSLNDEATKIWTAEDPIEITQRGLRQVQMQPKIGLDFAAAMRAFLRADPDVIMVGEMRDHETAAIAVEASLTGHLVLSTLHTNSAPETITRLLDMGLDPFHFADALLAVLAQRLARRLCSGCKKQRPATVEEREAIVRAVGVEGAERRGIAPGRELLLWQGPGCNACNGNGYKGRLGIHELLVADDDVKALVQKRAPVSAIRERAVAAGMVTLLGDGIDKAIAGETDLAQVFAVASR